MIKPTLSSKGSAGYSGEILRSHVRTPLFPVKATSTMLETFTQSKWTEQSTTALNFLKSFNYVYVYETVCGYLHQVQVPARS